ncbi:hypothetical protein [Marinicella gelatinilytica]|uniref:hypothetical protein n=1 Tax=Marinicella gelatinilytica TaxID=2996017 RepID=UPI00226088BE|nr:hypothetical protein [Marinicella gelatinilytica]MCX7545483.1 hypothetical protein [Marinicella gelatinilytica]
MIKLKLKDEIILSISIISATTLLIYGNLSTAGVIGMSVSIFSVIFIYFVSEFFEFTVSKELKNMLREMPENQREGYLKKQGLTGKEINEILKLVNK